MGILYGSRRNDRNHWSRNCARYFYIGAAMNLIAGYLERTGFLRVLKLTFLMFYVPVMLLILIPVVATALAQLNLLEAIALIVAGQAALSLSLWYLKLAWSPNKGGGSICQSSAAEECLRGHDGAPPSLLDQINSPSDLRKLDRKQLQQVANEVRLATIDAVSRSGGYLGSSLGVVELSVALHYVFNTPSDKLVWDGGHQTIPHKILTGRRSEMHTAGQRAGLSGFSSRQESVFDTFGAQHSGAAISAALGMAVARDRSGLDHKVVAVVGDGAFSSGMTYEALNNAGAIHSRLIVILNDNDMSVAPLVGAMSAYLARLLSDRTLLKLRDAVKSIASHLPRGVDRALTRVVEHTRTFVTGGTLFEEMGFYYVGPIDGHNLDHLLPILRNVRDADVGDPVLIHVVTQMGKGYAPAKGAEYFGAPKFDAVTGAQVKPKANAPSFTTVFGESLVKEGEKDDKIVAITAAMPSGTGVDCFQKAFPERSFDVGIAEQHAVTFAAGLATEGYKPFCAIYSTFLQRAYDQIINDVALQMLPVRFVIDRGGFVGADGPSHSGTFDIAFLSCLPNFVIMAPANESELVHMVATATTIDDRPSAIRFPRGPGIGISAPDIGVPIEVGRGRIVRQGHKFALLSLGARLAECEKAADFLIQFGWDATVVDARFAKPLDSDLILDIASSHKFVLTIEEGCYGGFGAAVLQLMADRRIIDVRVKTLAIPDKFLGPRTQEDQYRDVGLDASGIIRTIFEMLDLDISKIGTAKPAKIIRPDTQEIFSGALVDEKVTWYRSAINRKWRRP
jgi:1-deoxy-D-xylulose-5-phosphate synthase